MKLNRDQWNRLSGLLDEALEIESTEQEGWLRGLPPEAAALEEPLRVLLAQRAYVETNDFLKAPNVAGVLQDELARQRTAAQELTAGAQLGAYALVRELGQGGMGSVWLADRTDGRLKRQVALKIPYAGPHQRMLAERLTRERDILARLEHPNIARLYDADTGLSGQPYLVLEYVDGVPIHQYCDDEKLAVRERVVLFLQVLGAVQYAHSHLVIHRDLKPSNIFVTKDGVVRLLDFGIAKLMSAGEVEASALTQFGGRVLTPDYASPEQINGQLISTSSDVYSLGVVLYELLTGAKPYRLKRDSRASLEEAIAEADVIPPSRAPVEARTAELRHATPQRLARALRGDLDAIIGKALEKSTVARYASVDTFLLDIKHWLDNEPIEAQRSSTWYGFKKLVNRHRLAFGAATAVSLSLVVGASLAIWQARAAMTQTARLQATRNFLVDVFNASSKHQDDPLKAQQTTARELLDRAADRLVSEKQPSREETEEMLSILGGLYQDLGLDEKSATLRERRVALAKQLYGPNDLRTAEAQVDYAVSLYATDQWKLALPPLQDAERILDKHGDNSSFTRARQLVGMSEYLRGVDRERARQYADRGIALYRREFPKKPEFVEALRMGGLLELEAGRHAAALALFEEALTLQEQTGAAEVLMIRPLAELAEMQSMQSDLDGAQHNFERGLEISLRLNGESHVDTIQSRMRFGKFLRSAGKLKESQQMIQIAEQSAEQLLGNDETFHLPTVRDELAQTEHALGNFEVADGLFKRAIAVRETKRGGNRQHALMLVHHADLLNDMGHPEQSLRMLERAIGFLQKSAVPVGGGDVPAVMSAVYSNQGRHREALEALDRFAADQGLLTPTMKVELEMRRAAVLADLAEEDKAESLLREQLVKITQLPKPEYKRLLRARGQIMLGRLLMRRNASDEACALFEESMNIEQNDLSAQSAQLADSKIALAECLAVLGQTARSRSLLLEAKAINANHKELASFYRLPVAELERRLSKS